MSGPVQGQSKTRVIGLGYKPRKKNVELKWGVLETQPINKDEVTEYLYTKLGFESIVEGNDAIKAYVYEAVTF